MSNSTRSDKGYPTTATARRKSLPAARARTPPSPRKGMPSLSEDVTSSPTRMPAAGDFSSKPSKFTNRPRRTRASAAEETLGHIEEAQARVRREARAEGITSTSSSRRSASPGTYVKHGYRDRYDRRDQSEQTGKGKGRWENISRKDKMSKVESGKEAEYCNKNDNGKEDGVNEGLQHEIEGLPNRQDEEERRARRAVEGGDRPRPNGPPPVPEPKPKPGPRSKTMSRVL
ncbi:MAG: hypothetical protein Q9166_005371 [cf. Caloplaca sp. 2 TL-2023]